MASYGGEWSMRLVAVYGAWGVFVASYGGEWSMLNAAVYSGLWWYKQEFHVEQSMS